MQRDAPDLVHAAEPQRDVEEAWHDVDVDALLRRDAQDLDQPVLADVGKRNKDPAQTVLLDDLVETLVRSQPGRTAVGVAFLPQVSDPG